MQQHDSLGATPDEVADSLREDVALAFKMCNEQTKQLAAAQAALDAKDAEIAWLKARVVGYGKAITARYGKEEFGDLSESALQDAAQFQDKDAAMRKLAEAICVLCDSVYCASHLTCHCDNDE